MLTTCLSLLRCTSGRRSGRALFVLAAVVLTAGAVFAQDTAAQPSDASPQQPASAPQVTVTVSCASKIGETTHCPADTSKGVVLARSSGTAACLLGKTWGYDDKGVWVVGRVRRRLPCRRNRGAAAPPKTTKKAPRYIPNGGFLHRRGRPRRDVRPPFQLRALSQSARPRRDLHGRIRERAHGAAASGRAAAEVLPAVLRLVPDAEVPLLPLRLVVERRRKAIRRRSSAPATSAMCSTGTSRLAAGSPRSRAFAAPRASSPTGWAWTIASSPTSSSAAPTRPASGSRASSRRSSSTWR